LTRSARGQAVRAAVGLVAATAIIMLALPTVRMAASQGNQDLPHRLYAPEIAADSGGGPLPETCPDLDAFTYADALAHPSTLGAAVDQSDRNTGHVVVNGGDSRAPTTPFTFAWGDGQQTETFFPATHTYSDTTRTYGVVVTAHYQDGTSGSVTVPVRFAPADILPVAVDPRLTVTVPAVSPTLGTRLYPPPTGLEGFGESEFTTISRQDAEQLLSVGAELQFGYANGNILEVDAGFRQVVLKDPAIEGGMYSLWFTTPVSLAVGGDGFPFPSGIMGLFHEMGHNVSLSSPANFHTGGRLDGNANAIHSETTAQIFSYVTAYDLIRRGEQYGLDCATRRDIASIAVRDASGARHTFDEYVAAGHPFASWNDPASPSDETFHTFGTLAYKFLEHTVTDDVPPSQALQRSWRCSRRRPVMSTHTTHNTTPRQPPRFVPR
jgi:hypothetical protein